MRGSGLVARFCRGHRRAWRLRTRGLLAAHFAPSSLVAHVDLAHGAEVDAVLLARCPHPHFLVARGVRALDVAADILAVRLEAIRVE
eukprot:1006208-Prymnesium_polylepis.1